MENVKLPPDESNVTEKSDNLKASDQLCECLDKIIEKFSCPESPQKPTFCILNSVLIGTVIAYFVLFAAILVYVYIGLFRDGACQAGCNNSCVILVVMMALSTIVLIFILNAVCRARHAMLDSYYKAKENHDRNIVRTFAEINDGICKKMADWKKDSMKNENPETKA